MAGRVSGSKTAHIRLRNDLKMLQRDPVPYVQALPLPSNLLEWVFVIIGPENTPYEGGYYQGRLIFKVDYPFVPPRIIIKTPNGRFRVNERICTSMSDYHPETWNPSWSVSTILTALLSFFLEDSPTFGSIDLPVAKKRALAEESIDFNLNDHLFCQLFPTLAGTLRQKRQRASPPPDQAASQVCSPPGADAPSPEPAPLAPHPSTPALSPTALSPGPAPAVAAQPTLWLWVGGYSLCLIIGVALFAVVIHRITVDMDG